MTPKSLDYGIGSWAAINWINLMKKPRYV